MIVIVSGPPGAGKSSVARRLAADRARSVHLVSDEFYRWIVSGFVAPHLPEAHEQNEAVMDLALEAVRRYEDAGFDVFWDGVVGPWWMDSIVDGLGDRAATTHWLVLRPDVDVGLDRVRRRDGTTETSGAATMAAQFEDLGPDERFVIGANDDVRSVVRSCQQAIDAGVNTLATRTR